MEFLLFSVYYLYNYYMVCALLFHTHHMIYSYNIIQYNAMTSCYVTVTM